MLYLTRVVHVKPIYPRLLTIMLQAAKWVHAETNLGKKLSSNHYVEWNDGSVI